MSSRGTAAIRRRDPAAGIVLTTLRATSDGRLRRSAIALGSLLIVLMLGGCTGVSSASMKAVKQLVKQRHAPDVTAAEVEAAAYYQMQVTTGDARAVLTLGNVDGVRQAWYDSSGAVIFLEHGQVVQTSGLAQNLDGVRMPANDPFERGLQHLTGPLDYVRQEDWSPGYRYGVPVHARLEPAGVEQITILGQTHTVLRVDEELKAPVAGYHATNHYWVDPGSGFVWKSVQHLGPGPTVTLVQLSQYREKTP